MEKIQREMPTTVICLSSLDNSRVEVAAAVRRDRCSCSTSRQIHHNKAAVVIADRP